MVLGLRRRIGQSEDVIRQPSPESLVICELLEELHVVVEHGSHHAPQGFVMLDPGVLPVGVLPGVAVGGVPRNLGRDLLRNEAANPVRVLPGDIPELVVEGLEDVREAVEFRFRAVAAAGGRHRIDLGVLIRQLDAHCRLLLDPIAVHVDGLKDTFGQILFHGRGELRHEEVQKDRKLLPLGARVRQDRGEESVHAPERLGFALEVHLPVLVELLLVDRDAGVEDGVEQVAVRSTQIERHEPVDLRVGIHLIAVEGGFEVVQHVGVRLLAEDRHPVVVSERLLDGIGMVREVEDEHVVFLRVRPIETRQRLDRLDPGQDLVHVHRVQQRLVVPGLELVGTNEEPIRFLLDLVGDPPGRKAIEGRLTDLPPKGFEGKRLMYRDSSN